MSIWRVGCYSVEGRRDDNTLLMPYTEKGLSYRLLKTETWHFCVVNVPF